MNFSFKVIKTDSETKARTGEIITPHGSISTPNFIFCATRATIKGISPSSLKKAKVDIILSNTYHLMLQPGDETIARLGGLHKFMKFNGPMLTDSGGFQIFSLGQNNSGNEIKSHRNLSNTNSVKIREEGAFFKSYIDGSTQFLSPERSMDIQANLGADLILVLDECTPFHVSRRYTEKSMHRSIRWANRSLNQFNKNNKMGSAGPQALYGISQGGVYPDLRREYAAYLNKADFFGFAIGGSLGENKAQMHEVVEFARSPLQNDKPVHLLGIGGIDDIINGVQNGIDTFDCVSPTRLARHGLALINNKSEKYRLNIKNAKYKVDNSPIDNSCSCSTCKNKFALGYIHHLLKAKEMLGMSLISEHNIYFMTNFMSQIRSAIKNGTFDKLKKKFLS